MKFRVVSQYPSLCLAQLDRQLMSFETVFSQLEKSRGLYWVDALLMPKIPGVHYFAKWVLLLIRVLV